MAAFSYVGGHLHSAISSPCPFVMGIPKAHLQVSPSRQIGGCNLAGEVTVSPAWQPRGRWEVGRNYLNVCSVIWAVWP